MILFGRSAEILGSNLKGQVRPKLEALFIWLQKCPLAVSHQPSVLIFPFGNLLGVVFYSHSQDDFDQHCSLNELIK